MTEDNKITKPKKSQYANLHYIRAAIYQATGIYLSLDRTKQYLVEEGLLTQRQADSLVFDNYSSLYVETDGAKPVEPTIKPIDKEIII